MERANYIQALRALADFYEAHPEIEIWRVGNGYTETPIIDVNYSNSSEERFLAAAVALGEFDKSYDKDKIRISREMAPGYTLMFEADRSRFCTKVTKVIPAHTVEVPEETVEEWDCDSLLKRIQAMEAPAEGAAA